VCSSDLRDLRDRANASVIPDTLYMQLRAKLPNKNDAKTIAEVLQTVYMADQRRQSTAEVRSKISLLESTLRTTRSAVDSLDRRIDNLLAEEQVTTLEQRETAQYSEIQNIQPVLVEIRQQRALAREQLSSYEQLLNSPSGVQYPDTIRAQAEAHPIIQGQDQLITTEKAAIRALLARYGENHRDIIRRRNLLAALEQERNSLLEKKTVELFHTSIESLRSTIANLQESENDLQERLRQAENELVGITQVLKQHDNLQLDRFEKQEYIKSLTERIAELSLLSETGGRIVLASAPAIPDELAFPRFKIVVGGTAFLVCAAFAGLILLKEIREQRVRGPQDILTIPRTKVLGVVPDLSLDPSNPESVEMASKDKPQGVISETYRKIRGSIIKHIDERGHKAILITAGMPGSGATSVTTNIAFKFAVTGTRVLIIDGNMRRPSMHKVFGLSQGPGLAECLLGTASIDDAIRQTTHGNLDLLTAGASTGSVYEKLPTDIMAAIMTRAREKYDLVLVDSSPGIVAEDAISIANHCDACILVAQAFSEKRGLIARLRNQLGDTKAEFLGVIVNRVKSSAGGYFKKNYQTTHDYTFGTGKENKANAKNTEKTETKV